MTTTGRRLEARSRNGLTFPVGLGAGQRLGLGKLSVKGEGRVLQGQDAVIRPDAIRQGWNARSRVTPALPAPLEMRLLGR